jgi:type II secretory pathway pseudopilin PulG
VFTKYPKGFTLIEVLIAGVILFMVIAMTTLVYRSALLSSNKAEQVLAITGYLPIIIDNITEDLQRQDTGSQNSLQGDGNTMQVTYNWRARLIQSHSALSVLDSFTGELLDQPARYRLWEMDLTLTLGDSTRRYEYEDFTYPVLP